MENTKETQLDEIRKTSFEYSEFQVFLLIIDNNNKYKIIILLLIILYLYYKYILYFIVFIFQFIPLHLLVTIVDAKITTGNLFKTIKMYGCFGRLWCEVMK